MPLSDPPAPSRAGVAQESGWTKTRIVAELFAGKGSVIGELALAVLESAIDVPGAVTTIETVTFAAAAIVPSVQLTVPADCVQVPWLGVADTKTTPVGKTSVMVVDVATATPKFWTVTL
jgi:hypothetical protein